ncbi:hypothetical protein [Nakamurella deserti]|uniref:hypothetical protein n=1 Tax=Nakamurella deserti TaxID=2164074 RepID=UPI000DBE6752|nr:hypothetical protein [Nakamurella deserti]
MRARAILLFAAPIVAVILLSWVAWAVFGESHSVASAAASPVAWIPVVPDPDDDPHVPAECDGLPVEFGRAVTDPADVVALTLCSAVPPPGCAQAERLDHFLTVVTAPPAGGPSPVGDALFTVQADGCRVVVDEGWAVLGFADPVPVERLLAGTS